MTMTIEWITAEMRMDETTKRRALLLAAHRRDAMVPLVQRAAEGAADATTR